MAPAAPARCLNVIGGLFRNAVHHHEVESFDVDPMANYVGRNCRIEMTVRSPHLVSELSRFSRHTGNPAIIMDSSVLTQRPVSSERDRLLEVLNKAHDLIHDSFIEMTKPIHPLMNPRSLAQ